LLPWQGIVSELHHKDVYIDAQSQIIKATVLIYPLILYFSIKYHIWISTG